MFPLMSIKEWIEALISFLKYGYTWIFILLLSISLYLMTYANILGVKDLLIDYLKHIPSNPHANRVIASFVNGNLATDEGSPFHVCDDSMYAGRSKIGLKIIKESTQSNYLQAEFDLNPGDARLDNSYACFFADFETPNRYVNLGKYQGIRFKSRVNLKQGDIDNLLLIISIDTQDEECHTPSENNYVTKTAIGKFKDVTVDFKELGTPGYMRDKKLPPFDPRAAYRVTFTIGGEKQAGTLDIADIQFY